MLAAMHMPQALETPLTQPVAAVTAHHAGFNALRASLTLLVLFHHTAITYGALGGWYFHEITPDKSVATILLVLFCSVNQAYFMGLFFLLTGYYSPAALHRKGSVLFLLDRSQRLGLPLLFYGWILGPITIALAAIGNGHSFTRTLLFLWRHATFDSGPLWFAQALLIFSLGYVLVAWLVAALSRRRAPQPRSPRPFPTNLSLLVAAVGTGVAALILRVYWPVGVNLWNLQLGYFASYILLFATGCSAAQPRWLEHLPPAQVRLWWRIALVVFPLLPLLYFLGQVFPPLRGRPVAIAYAFWEPLLAWGIILYLLDWFQRRVTRLNTLWHALSRRAYTIYIIHPPVLVAITLLWRTVPAYPLVKVAVTGSLTCLVCFLVAGGLLRVPGLRRVV